MYYCQTLPLSNPNVKPTNPFKFSNPNPNSLPRHSLRFQSVSKFRFGYCNSAKRVSESPSTLRKHVAYVGIGCDGLFGAKFSNPSSSPAQSAGFQSVPKFGFGFCNSAKRVSESPNNLRKHDGFVGIRSEGIKGENEKNDQDDGFYIRRCVELARKAIGFTSPNPMVGCVIVKDGKIVGEGFHPKAGQPHAEVFALRNAGDLAENATAYVSLEPCNHFGKTPPCSEALVKAKLKRVVVGMVDPNPLVASRGVARLRDAGIDVTVGVEEELCKKLNEAWIHYMQTGLPFVTLRYSLGLGGGLSNDLGDESTDAGGYYSKLLQQHDAVILSSTSTSTQNSSLPISKEPNANQPLCIILARNPIKISYTHKQTTSNVIVFTDQETDVTTKEGIETVVLEKTDLTTILDYCKCRGLCSVLLDLRGGVGDFAEILEGLGEKLVQKFVVEVLPFWGDNEEKISVGAIKIGKRLNLKNFEPKIVGKSVLLEGYFW